MSGPRFEVRVLPDRETCALACLDEVRAVVSPGPRPLISFATGNTFTPFFALLAVEITGGRIPQDGFLVTHLDEYVGFPPDRSGGMVHELLAACPPLESKLRAGTFFPVPQSGSAADIGAHRDRLARAGGVALQFLGIGRNGHLAFNEPGTDFDVGFHRCLLAATTKKDAAARFAPDQPPEEAVTAGLADVLDARRVVLVATGASKAAAVRAMLEGEVGVACPATALRGHGNALVLLDPAAAGE